MKQITKTLLVALLCAAARANAQFEGLVESRNFMLDDNGVGQQFDMTIWVRRDMVKVRIPAVGGVPGSTVVYRHDRKISWVFNDAEKTYFEVSLADQSKQRSDQDPDKPKVERTKRSRKLLGYTCEQILLRRGESETEIWAARGLGDLATRLDSLLGNGEGISSGTDTELLRQLQLFPLISITRYDGKVIDSQEVTKIERRPLTLDLFVIPPDYKKQASMEPVERE
jgi:hypothetical protein